MPAPFKDSLRLFYALWPDDETRVALTTLQNPLIGKKTPYENLHITLAFLGEQPSSVIPDLTEILSHLPVTNFTLTLDRIGYFHHSKIAWTGMHATPKELIYFRQELIKQLNLRNISFDNKNSFTPHATLARNASPIGDIVFAPIAWKANELVLAASLPPSSTSSPSYKVIASRRLNQEIWVTDECGFNKSLLDTEV